MWRDVICAALNSALVLQAGFYCLFQSQFGVEAYGGPVYLPIVQPLLTLDSYAYDQSAASLPLLTSGAATIVQPALQRVLNTAGQAVPALLGNSGVQGSPLSGPNSFLQTFLRGRGRRRRPRPFPGKPPSNNKTDDDGEWDYDDTTEVPAGPGRWPSLFPKCGQTLQSPINLAGPNLRFREMTPIRLSTSDGSGFVSVTIKNDGTTLSIKPNSSTVLVDGGSLPGQFVVTNVHFHWSKSDNLGSEHTMEGKAYPLEVHVVSFNSKYQNMQQASGADDGIHVMGVLYQISKRTNRGLSFCTSKLDSIIEADSETEGGYIDIRGLVPLTSSHLFRYRGSLTTPPCTENIIWTVFSQPEPISLDQLNKFRSLKLRMNTNPSLGANSRPVQQLNNRVIFTNNPRF